MSNIKENAINIVFSALLRGQIVEINNIQWQMGQSADGPLVLGTPYEGGVVGQPISVNDFIEAIYWMTEDELVVLAAGNALDGMYKSR